MSDVFFYANGLPRLLMSCVIGDEIYPGARKHLILLHQYGYHYDGLLPRVEKSFSRVYHLRVRARRYSHFDQLLNSYLNPYPGLRRFFRPGSEVVLFGIRSPVQKFIVRHNKRLGNTVRVYAESLAVDRFLEPRRDGAWWRRIARRCLARAFDVQHEYDVFYVVHKELYRHSPWYDRLETMFPLYASPSFAKHAALLTRDLDLSGLAGYGTVFFGQPLSNFDGLLAREDEEGLLRSILGDREVLILPHPNEVLEKDNKYGAVPNGRLFRAGIPNDLLLLALRPKVTMTYSSTIGVNYAVMNPESTNHFFPLDRSRYELLCRYRQFIPNLVVSDALVRDPLRR
ncbi:MAG TPA: hypothetical protein VHC97_16115 [Thermoanaerobaculia bacterium]|nr:hypothetical protein [Thermoanaerobaculia bacterium]